MNVSLTRQQHTFVEKLVKAGQYASNSEVIRDGLRLLHEQQLRKTIEFQKLKRQIDEGIEDSEAGRVLTSEQFERAFDAHKRAFLANRKSRK